MTIEEFIEARLSQESMTFSTFAPVVPMLSLLGTLHFDDGGHCATCHAGEHRPPSWPCVTAKLTAGIWSGHPDYRQEWAV